MTKNKQHFISELSSESKNSSTALLLQQFRNDVEKREMAAEAAKSRCRICFKETAPTPRCFGHGSGGGGGSGSGSATGAEDVPAQTADKFLSNSVPAVDELIDEFSAIETSEYLDDESLTIEERYNPELLAELIEKGVLLINNNRQSMTLAVSLLSEQHLLSDEQKAELKQFMNAILTEFQVFKEQHNLSDECLHLTQDNAGNILSLRINLPTLKLYDAFIQQLANNLLPTPTPQMNVEAKQVPVATDEIENEELPLFNPSPFSTQLLP